MTTFSSSTENPVIGRTINIDKNFVIPENFSVAQSVTNPGFFAVKKPFSDIVAIFSS